jgi:hypothetical protein
MKKARILGYTIETKHEDAGTREYQDHDEGYKKYNIFIQIDDKFYTFSGTEEYGSCGSGWCSASWASLDLSLIETHNVSDRTKNEIFIELTDDLQIIRKVKEPVEFYDAIIECVETTDGELLISSSGNGGCDYYSSGTIKFNEDLFK